MKHLVLNRTFVSNSLAAFSAASAALVLLTPADAAAIPPPDIIYSMSSQLPQLGYLLLLGFSTAFASIGTGVRYLCTRKRRDIGD